MSPERDSMYLQPVVRCKNPDCPMPSAARIRLPYPNPPKTGATPPNWPQDGWQLRLICRECDHWYVYGKEDVMWAPYSSALADHSGLDFECIELECAEPGCGFNSASNCSIRSSFSSAASRSSILSPAISALACPTASECATLCFMRSKAAAFEPSPMARRASLAFPTARARRC